MNKAYIHISGVVEWYMQNSPRLTCRESSGSGRGQGGCDMAGNWHVRRSRHWVGQSNNCGYGRAGVYGQEINIGVAVNMGDDSEGVVSECRCGYQSMWQASMWQASIWQVSMCHAVFRCCS